MQKLRNILLTALVTCGLFSVIAYDAMKLVDSSSDEQTYSALEGRKLQTFPELNIASVLNSQFQNKFEKYVADSVPLRSKIMLGNAFIQRSSIQAASLLFGFDSYPTFYGSNYCYTTSTDRIEEMPALQSSKSTEALNSSAAMFNSVAESHPDQNWYIYLPDRTSYSEASALHSLESNTMDYNYYENNFIGKLSDEFTFIDGSYASLEEHNDDFFSTDHHWQIQGAYKAYVKIAKAMGCTPIQANGFTKSCSSKFWGSCARNGLATIGKADTIYDIEYAASKLTVYINGKKNEIEALDKIYSSDTYKKADKYSNVYAEWFHTDYGTVTIKNSKKEGSLLIVGDSFTNNCERLYAENYGTVYVVDPRHTNETLNGFLESHQVDDVLIMLCGGNYTTQATLNALK